MSTYAIGDIQGCYQTLRSLLDEIGFDPSQDRLWFVGDLVNRGPASLETLRFVRGLGDAVQVVLGNHDLYLLMVAYGVAPKRGKDDTLAPILAAEDRDELLTWLRHQPLCFADRGFCMVHAGLLPGWTVADALKYSDEVSHALKGKKFLQFLGQLWGSTPDAWSDQLKGVERLRMIVNVMTRMRFCYPDGRLEFKTKGLIEKAPHSLVPWFELPEPTYGDHTLLFGHWSALGLRFMENIISIDTGCLWGGKLTAIRLEDRAVFQVDPALGDRQPVSF